MQQHTKRITLHETHVSLGGKMVPFAGFEMPVRYTSDIEEHRTVREGVGVFDVSHMGEFFVRGPQALALIQRVTSNDASLLEIGQAQYSCLPNDRGGIVDDLLVYKLAEEEYMLVVNASNIEKDWDWINQHNQMGAELENRSDEISLFAVQGPKAIEALQPLTELDLGSIPFYHFKVGTFAGAQDVIVSATGYTGAGGFELYVKNDDALATWQALFESGKHLGIKPIGLGARDTLRLEMGYCLYGNDITDETSPIEAGLGWITKFSKEFIHSEQLKEQKASGVTRKLVGFKLTEKGIPRSHYPILDTAGNVIGEVTSGTQSPSMGIGIGLGYVESAYAKPGTPIAIGIRNKTVQAVVQKLPLLTA
ncbi:Aminomethyltransferase (glycine cleavage system T protein) [Lunatimonas lonarensis]|uniref:Aminomethyltransferase n=1 Tax=Lunatimonas lonarensis TaxID=1232681 RepID=R7ZS70_9BACT|nr:glycine cleavage system aminomethyltransferase GcvT [Lunatimonas lonarensis]EON76955.1 Aminomethyltransferase (glycine cleavage system T protein) [Lunatimonas lonarensis]